MAEKTVEQLMAENAVLKSFVAKAYNKSETEIDGLITDETGVRDDGFENLLTLDTSKTKRLKGDSQTMFDKGYQKAEAEIKSKAEKSFKEKTGFNEDAETFEELLDKYVEQQAKNPKKSAFTDDDVKKHSLFLAKEKELQKVISESIPKSEHEKYVQEIEQKKIQDYINSKIIEKFNSMNIETIENPKIKAKRLENMLKEAEKCKYQIDGESIIVLNADGTRKEDDHMNPVEFNEYSEGLISDHFIILKQSPKGSAGNGNPDVKTTPAGTVTIKDEAHYAELMAEIDARQAAEKDPAKVIEIRKERAKLGETWMNQSKK
jgi:hypothetical protein